ncbi:tellurite resistance TerB family protein [Paenalcaligenes sp. Me131]|uniref:tellurite resistance TerB family protein n=1 Tax=Paenalcaligenes sp. Me131 TaxID=3392636 RepID=UPI003D2AEC64
MSLQNVLQQLMQSAQAYTKSATTPKNEEASSNSFSVKSFAGGALSGGALALLLGNKKFRKVGGKVAMYGGVAAIGALAYRAYGDWKQKGGQPAAASTPTTPSQFAQLPAPVLEHQSRLVLAAMISAAKADGHINQEEQALLDAEFSKLPAGAAEQQWITAQLEGPADPSAIAKLATTPEEKAEVYLVSVLITEADSFMEKAYLDELSKQLQLEPGLKEHLEQTALQVTA